MRHRRRRPGGEIGKKKKCAAPQHRQAQNVQNTTEMPMAGVSPMLAHLPGVRRDRGAVAREAMESVPPAEAVEPM
eukprot:gene25697-biopygen19511